MHYSILQITEPLKFGAVSKFWASSVWCPAASGVTVTVHFGVTVMICPLLGGPKSMLFWTTKEIENAIEEAQASSGDSHDYDQVRRQHCRLWRNIDGQWMVAADIFNSDGASTPQD